MLKTEAHYFDCIIMLYSLNTMNETRIYILCLCLQKVVFLQFIVTWLLILGAKHSMKIWWLAKRVSLYLNKRYIYFDINTAPQEQAAFCNNYTLYIKSLKKCLVGKVLTNLCNIMYVTGCAELYSSYIRVVHDLGHCYSICGYISFVGISKSEVGKQLIR